jgi:hypothetical protein
MDLLLLGAAAIALVALTIWLVWRPAEAPEGDVRAEEANQMLPQGDRFEDQYTSATADLSAGGVAVTAAQTEQAPVSEMTDYQGIAQPSLARESAPAALQSAAPVRALPEPSVTTRLRQPKMVSMGAAALLTLGGALGGAWLYSRWHRERNKPIRRVLRRFR